MFHYTVLLQKAHTYIHRFNTKRDKQTLYKNWTCKFTELHRPLKINTQYTEICKNVINCLKNLLFHHSSKT